MERVEPARHCQERGERMNLIYFNLIKINIIF